MSPWHKYIIKQCERIEGLFEKKEPRKTYFDYEFNGERGDLEQESRDRVIEWATEAFESECYECCEYDSNEDEGYIIEYYYDDDTGEKVDVAREKLTLYWEREADYA